MSTATTEFVDAEYCLESIKSTLSKLSAIDFDEYEEADLIRLERMFDTLSGRIDKFKTLKEKEIELTQKAEAKAAKEAERLEGKKAKEAEKQAKKVSKHR